MIVITLGADGHTKINKLPYSIISIGDLFEYSKVEITMSNITNVHRP